MNSGYRLVAHNLSRIKLVTFDVTDTLLKFSRPPEIQYAMAARQHGCTEVNEQLLSKCFRANFKRMAREYPNFGKSSNQDWRWWWRTLVMDIFRESHGHIDEEKLSLVADQLIGDYQTKCCWTKLEQADKIIGLMREHRKQVGIISNFDPRLGNIVRAMDLPNVDFILTSYEAGCQKPCSKIFDYALNHCTNQVLSSEALHIGNTPQIDYLGAKNAGWFSALVNVDNDGIEGILQNKQINPKHIFKDFQEFIHVLETFEINW